MHEFSLLADLMKKINQIADSNGVEKVTAVHVSLGALAHISGEHFREHFVHAARGTVAEGATLQVTEKTDRQDPLAQEILLESVEVEEG